MGGASFLTDLSDGGLDIHNLTGTAYASHIGFTHNDTFWHCHCEVKVSAMAQVYASLLPILNFLALVPIPVSQVKLEALKNFPTLFWVYVGRERNQIFFRGFVLCCAPPCPAVPRGALRHTRQTAPHGKRSPKRVPPRTLSVGWAAA